MKKVDQTTDKGSKSFLLNNISRRFIYVLLVLIVITVGSWFSYRTFVTAQAGGQGLEVSPPSQEATIDPGKTITVKAKIRNKGNNTLPMTVHIEDFTAKGDQGQVELNSDSPYSVANWTKVSPSSFTLDAGAEQEVTATIKAPANAAGGHFGSFVFSVTPDNAQPNAATVTQEIASLFLVRVSGPVDENLAISSFSAPQFSEFGPVPFNIEFSNSGNVFVKTYGLVNVTDMFGRKVADIVVPGTNIFPQAQRVVKSQLNNRFLIGKYTATAIMYYGSQNQSLTATSTFYAFPVRIAAIILVVLVFLFAIRKRLKKAMRALRGK